MTSESRKHLNHIFLKIAKMDLGPFKIKGEVNAESV